MSAEVGTAHPNLKLVHALCRRVRFLVPPIRKDRERVYVLEILLRKWPAVRRVRSTPGIASFTVDFDPGAMPRDQLLARIDAIVPKLGKSGRSAPSLSSDTGTRPLQHLRLAVEGMTCASCAMLVELALKRDPRVREAAVNFGSETATVRGTLSREDVARVVGRYGYRTRPMDTLAQRRLVVEAERARLEEAKRRALLAGLLTLPVIIVGMAMPRTLVPKLLELALTTPVVFWAGKPFFEKARLLARQRTANMDTLIALGAGSAYLYSVPAMMLGRHYLYFEAAAAIVSFVLLGRYLEERAKGRAGEAIRRLIDLQPPTATLIRDGRELVVAVDELVVGDLILVRPGERVPTDGEILEGLSTVDESMVTGESMPVVKKAGGKVVGGCINGTGSFRMRASAVGADTVLAGIIRMVDDAQADKLPVQKMADRISAVFVPSVMAGAGITFLLWMAFTRRFPQALVNAISVLLIACPCAFGLATPTAIMAGTGSAARRGIYIRNGESLETASRIDTLVFDKTGTITEGHPRVTDWLNRSALPDMDLLGLIAGLEGQSEHFLGQAIRAFAKRRGAHPEDASVFQSDTGAGVRGQVGRHALLVGNTGYLQRQGIDPGPLLHEVDRLSRQGKTTVLVALDGDPAALLGIADRPRAGARAAVERLHRMGIETWILTGDTEPAARHIAVQVGIPRVVAGASPARKLAELESLRARGRIVGMIGDGINDAPALAAADVGFAVGSGTDVAIEASHIALVGGDIARLTDALLISRKTMTIIRQNLFWALIYNGMAIPVAAVGRLNPMIASAAMAMSSVSVVTNSLRLQWREKSL